VSHYIRLKCFAADKHSRLRVYVMKKIRREFDPRDNFNSASYFLKLTNKLNKLECFIAKGWNVLLWTSTFAYWAYLYIMKKIKCWEYNYRPHVRNISIFFII